MSAVSLHDLRIAALPGPALRLALDRSGPWTDVRTTDPADGADLVVVDTAGLGPEGADVDAIARWASAAGARSVLWSTRPAELDEPLLGLADAFDAVAAADAALTRILSPAGRRAVRVPWGAAPVDAFTAQVPLIRRAPVAAVVGAWSTENRSAANWLRAVLLAIGLDRVELVELPELLAAGASAAAPWPEDLEPASRGHGADQAAALLARARVVISADASTRATEYVAPGYLHAMASGAALVAYPQKTLAQHFLRAPALTPNPRDEELPTTLGALIAGGDAKAQERASAGAALAVRQHAIAHRLASLASLVGLRALAD